jgi:hypothetical protein
MISTGPDRQQIIFADDFAREMQTSSSGKV